MATSSDLRQFAWRLIFGSTHIPKGADLSGKTIVVTGANTGLGFECAKHLCVQVLFLTSPQKSWLTSLKSHRARLKVATLILACRTPQKGNAAKDAIIKAT